MHLELMRDRDRDFPVAAIPNGLRSLRAWHCKYRSLQPIADLRTLEGLEIATFPDDTLEVIADLSRLRYLHIIHLPLVSDLAPLAALKSLVTLRLATLPSWDASGKLTVVSSLEPLAELPDLRHVELFGVVPEDRSPMSLLRCDRLRSDGSASTHCPRSNGSTKALRSPTPMPLIQTFDREGDGSLCSNQPNPAASSVSI